MQRAYFVFENVGITRAYLRIDDPRVRDTHFIIHDDSDQIVVEWHGQHHNFFPSLASFEEVQEQQGLREDDWVQEIFLRTFLKQPGASHIVEVLKVKSRPARKETLAEKVARWQSSISLAPGTLSPNPA